MTPTSPVRLESDFQPYGNGSVRPHRIRFDPSDPAFLSKDADGLLTFRVLAPPDAIEAMLVVRTDEGAAGYRFERIGAAGATSLWETVIEPPGAVVVFSLAFRLEGDVPVYLSPTGLSSAIERIDRFEVNVSAVPVHEMPDWAAGAVIYQVFPERYASSGAHDPARQLDPWSVPPTSRSFLGGDLGGITSNVTHLVELGIDVLYLNPIFASPSNHRYDTIDYRSVDPTLGGDEALRELVDVLHRHGMRVILDVSLNHCHPRFFAFADLVANGIDSPYAGWFDVHDWPVRVAYRPQMIESESYWGNHLDRLRLESGLPLEEVAGDGPALEPTYDAWYGVPLMPRIDLRNQEARRYMLDVAKYWVREFDVDGWRMDVVRYVDHDFWADLRREVKAINSDVYLLAEVMGDARRWLKGDEFDGVMNYTFRDLLVDYFAVGTIDTEAFAEGLLELAAMYSPAATMASQNLLGSHDTPRFLTVAGGDRRSLLLATLVQLTLPGAPGLYYGDEVAMEGGPDPDNRRGMTWDAIGNDQHRQVQELLRLREHHPALSRGDWRLLCVVGGALAYERRHGTDRVVVAVNRGTDTALLPLRRLGDTRWSAGSVTRTADGLRLGGRSGVVLA